MEPQPEFPQKVALPHPLSDASGPGWVASLTHAPVVRLSSGREALLVDAARAGVRVLLVTPPTARITVPLYQLLSLLGGIWLTRDDAGVIRHAVSGEIVESFEQAAESGLARGVEQQPWEMPDVPGRVPASSLTPWMQVSVAVHHPARAETSLGGAAETLIQDVSGQPPTAWGTSEPSLVAWDRARLTALFRSRMPQDSRAYVSGEAGGIRYSGSIRAARSDIGVTEETRIVFALPEDLAVGVSQRAGGLSAGLADRQHVLMATAWTMRGAPDAAISPYWPTSPQPLAAVIGARGVRSMALDPATFEQQHGALRTGNRRTPSLVFEFGADDLRWQRFADALRAVGAEKIVSALTPDGVRHAS